VRSLQQRIAGSETAKAAGLAVAALAANAVAVVVTVVFFVISWLYVRGCDRL